MKNLVSTYFLLCLLAGTFSACQDKIPTEPKGVETQEKDKHNESGIVLTNAQVARLGIRIDSIPMREMGGGIEVSGRLEVPPQHEARVTSRIGANVSEIKVIEGDRVRKGQVLASLSHPDLTQLQTDYLKAFSQLAMFEEEMTRQKRLFEENVGSGKSYREAKTAYEVQKAEVAGYELQLRQLHVNPERIQGGTLYHNFPVISPIAGYVEKVLVQIGEYAAPQKEMFLLLNTDHLHADFMVFERDAHRVQDGQRVVFSLASRPDREFIAEIYSVGRKLEEKPRGIHVHAEITSHDEYIVPGMFIHGTILTSAERMPALPASAFVEENGGTYVFTAERLDESNWRFDPFEVTPGEAVGDWVGLRSATPPGKVVWNNTTLLMAEINKEGMGHHH